MNQEQKAYISLINESSEESIVIKKSNNLYIIRDSPYSDK